MTEYETTHMTPPEGSGVMPCCGLSPFERQFDRITLDLELVTCGIADFAAADAELAAGETRPLRYLLPRWRPWWVSEILIPILVALAAFAGSLYLVLWMWS